MAKESGSKGMHFTVEIEREKDGRWIAEVMDLPGVLAYGKTRKGALGAAEALALRVLANVNESRDAECGLLPARRRKTTRASLRRAT